MTKSITTGRAVVNLPTQFLSPITVAVCGDDDADAKAVAKGWGEYEQKLIDFARYLAVPLETPDDVLALHRTLAPVAKQFAGFEFRVVKRAGTRLEKTSAYYWQLALGYEWVIRNNNAKISKTAFAMMVATSIVNPKQRRATSVMLAQIKARADQIRNDLTQTNHPALRGLARAAVDLFQQELTPEEFTQRLEREAENIISALHKN